MSANWIWYPGDFEIYHHLLLSGRRERSGVFTPCMWKLDRPEAFCQFTKSVKVEKDTEMTVVTRSVGAVKIESRNLPVNKPIKIKAGEYEILVSLYDSVYFPAFFIDSDAIKTDKSWKCHSGDKLIRNVGYSDMFTKAEDNPYVFPFSYEDITPVSSKSINGGILYDFGKETFAVITLDKIAEGDRLTLIYGESEEEALCLEEAVISETLTVKDSLVRPARALRYLFINSEKNALPDISARYEYYPIKDAASFTSKDSEIEKIWSLCSYTLHLNSREFFLDGIKRDRWVWSGDAYQSYMIARYLYADNDITKRTIRALLGKPEFTIHINTIIDYSYYLIMAISEYYDATLDREFVESVYPETKALFGFIQSKLDENGFSVVSNNDWAFIDWGDIDTEGTNCAEQILLSQAYLAMDNICAVMGEKTDYSKKAERLKKQIIAKWWREDKHAFIDCYDTGKEHISKQSNIFAVMFGMVDRATCEKIMECVIDNPDVTPVTTPYFKFYELIARCTLGDIEGMQDFLRSYWGGMIKLGATSIWEEYNPECSGVEHYAMYDLPFEKSLCHAWGSGPIYLIGRFVAGVEMTSPGYKTFSVTPHPGSFSDFEITVPVGSGSVTVSYKDKTITAVTDKEGGTLIVNGKEIKLTPEKCVSVRL